MPHVSCDSDSVWGGGGGVTSPNFWYKGSARNKKLEPIGCKVL